MLEDASKPQNSGCIAPKLLEKVRGEQALIASQIATVGLYITSNNADGVDLAGFSTDTAKLKKDCAATMSKLEKQLEGAADMAC